MFQYLNGSSKIIWAEHESRKLTLFQYLNGSSKIRYYWFILSLVTFEVIKLGDKEVKPLDMHIFFKERFLPKKVVSITSINGELLQSEMTDSSRNLNKIEFADYIDKIKEFADTYLNLQIPNSNEFQTNNKQSK